MLIVDVRRAVLLLAVGWLQAPLATAWVTTSASNAVSFRRLHTALQSANTSPDVPIGRRPALSFALAVALLAPTTTSRVHAEEEASDPARTPAPAVPAARDRTVTSVVELQLRVGSGSQPEIMPLKLQLFGNAAPESVAAFVALAQGDLPAVCADSDPDSQTITQRAASTKRAAERDCLERQGGGLKRAGVSLDGSQLWRIVPNRRIDLGRIAPEFASRVPPTIPAEHNDLRPSERGAVSVKRGGGAFEFSIAPVTNPTLDKEDLVVIGTVAVESLPVVDMLNKIPAKRGPFDIGDDPPVAPLGTKFSRACEYSSPDPTCAQFKPLKKVSVGSASVQRL